jgi:hypothetical protein
VPHGADEAELLPHPGLIEPVFVEGASHRLEMNAVVSCHRLDLTRQCGSCCVSYA